MDTQVSTPVNWQGNWDERRMGQLKELYQAGLSFSLIADEIGGITRNAAIGKARRMGLPKRVKVVESKPYIRHPRAPPPRPRRHSAVVRAAFVEKQPEIIPGVDYRCTIYELKDSSCRYPLWPMSARHHERLYCGVPAASVSNHNPYCPRHTMLCDAPPR